MSFDVDKYALSVKPVKWDDLDLETGFKTQKLSQEALRTLRYMSDVETHTICYLRDLLVTPSHADPVVTKFLASWSYEEQWHGEVLDKVLEVHGVQVGNAHTMKLRTDLGWKDKLAPVRQSILANVIGEDFVATHMIWGAVNEYATKAAYDRFVKKENHPVLTEILRRIAKQETNHIAFYSDQARTRLERSAKARKIARFALNNFWGIVGSTIMPKTETAHLLEYLFGGVDGLEAAHQLDKKVDKFIGLNGLHLFERQRSKYGVA